MQDIHSLYDGSIELVFNHGNHSYYVQDGDKKFRVPSVTTICGMIDKSAALVPWAVNCTLNYLKKAIVPDVGIPEMELATIFDQAKQAHRVVKQEAADIGTQAHNWLENYFKSGVAGELPADERVTNCVNAALGWLAEHEVESVAIEKKIYSKKHKFSGTLDKLARVDGVLCLIDWKSSKFVYPEHRLQTAAYVAAFEEETGTKVDSRWLIQLGKETGEFVPHRYPRSHQKKDFKAFIGALNIYNRLKEMK